MIEYPKWKLWLVLVVMALATLYAVPNLYPQDYAVQVTPIREAVLDDSTKDKIAAALKEAGLQSTSIELRGKQLLVRVADSDTQQKALGVVAQAVGQSYNTALNLATTTPDWMRAIGGRPVTLGLDLQGGVHFLMEVDQETAQKKVLERTQQALYQTMRDRKITYRSITQTPEGLVIRLDSPKDKDDARDLLTTSFPDLTAEEAPGNDLLARFKPEALSANAASVIEQNTVTLRNRINSTGVAEPAIQRQGLNRIVVQLPGVQDTAAAKRIISATATLEYRAVISTGPAAQAAVDGGRIPPEGLVMYKDGGEPVIVSKEIIASGEQLISASDGVDPKGGTPMVSVRLNAAGGARMLDFTSRNVGKPMAVIYVESIPTVKMVDGKEERSSEEKRRVINDASIQGVFSTDFQTTGLGSRAEAKELANFLKAGSLAAPMTIVEERVVGPSQGRDNIERGRNAVVIGLVGIIIFMGIYYKAFGLISIIGLAANLILLLAMLSLFKATMTMPGIAGLALTMGMAIDANVLVAERIREELRNGQTPLMSIKAGYEKAWATIFDSNITTLIAGLALFALGSGPIRGFALVLCLGILTTMFTAITVTYTVLAIRFAGRRKIARISI
jgi:preprotein translocase subunit SecD